MAYRNAFLVIVYGCLSGARVAVDIDHNMEATENTYDTLFKAQTASSQPLSSISNEQVSDQFLWITFPVGF